MQSILTLRLQSVGVSAAVAINGLTVLRLPASPSAVPLRQMKTLPIHEYIRQGDNAVELTVCPAAAAAEQDLPPGPLALPDAAAVRVQLVLTNVALQSDRILFEEVLAHDDLAQEVFPLTRRRTVAIPVRFPVWRWLEVPPCPINEVSQGLLIQLYYDLLTDLALGQTNKLAHYARLHIEELATAYQTTQQAVLQSLSQTVVKAYGEGRLEIKAKPRKDIWFCPVAGGRLIELKTITGDPLISTGSAAKGAVPFCYPVRCAVLDNQVLILR